MAMSQTYSNNSAFKPPRAELNPNEDCSKELDFAFWIINGVLGVLILLGNSLTCATFLRFETLRRSYMNLLLLSLAICDAAMAVIVTPGYATFCTGCLYNLSAFCWFFEGGKDVCLLTSTFNLLAISYDRQLAIFQPLKYQAKMSRRKIHVILSVVWLTPLCLASPRNIWSHTRPENVVEELNRTYSYILLFVFVILPIIIVSVINATIFIAIKKQRRKVTAFNGTNCGFWRKKQNRMQYLQLRKGTLSCVLVVVFFVVCWLPRTVYYSFYLFNRPELVTPILRKISITFLLLQSSTNPLIYCFYRKEFRRAVKTLIKCS
ncbi:melanopsin-like [Stylophora pistillata]|uniref:melanopsin-like n=1 Tax=Stylophora pistillata TaxID=50429 RepID=UPI000C04F7B5|nr:melanopsin-like [Stylophora pistillata]